MIITLGSLFDGAGGFPLAANDAPSTLHLGIHVKNGREKAMPKKRNCRRNEHEKELHDQAVVLRKMTDAKLIEYMNKQYTAGIDTGRISNEIVAQDTAKQILQAIRGIKGIGAATISKIETAVREILNPCKDCPMEHDCYTDYTDKRHECGTYSKYLEMTG